MIERTYTISKMQHFKWKLKTIWPIYLIFALIALGTAISFLYMGYKIIAGQIDRVCLALFVISLVGILVQPVSILFLKRYSNKILYEEVTIEIDPISKVIKVTSKDERDNVLITINPIAYRKEKNKYFMIGNDSVNFFYVPKAGLKKDQIYTIRKIILVEPKQSHFRKRV